MTAGALEQETRNIVVQVTLTLQILDMLDKCRWSLLHCGKPDGRKNAEGWLKCVRTFVSERLQVDHFPCFDIEGRDGYEPYAVSVSAVGWSTWTWALNPFPEGTAATLFQ
jgi:hypothetical protein